MCADHSSELLPDEFQCLAVECVDGGDVGDERGIQLDREAGGEIDSEMIMRNQRQGACGHNLQQCPADQFSIRVSESVIRDLPDFGIDLLDLSADIFELRAGADDNCRWSRAGINPFRSGGEFSGRIVEHAVLVGDISKNSRHYFSPPLAATSSTISCAFSSRVPLSMRAPLPSAGTK